RTSSCVIPPRSASDSASSSARSAVSATTPTSARPACLTRSSMRARPAALATTFTLGLRRRARRGPTVGRRRHRGEFRSRRGGGRLFRLLEHRLHPALPDHGLALASRVFGLALLPHREQ